MQYDLSILFFLKKAQVDKKGLTPIYLRITVNGHRVEISTNRKIEVSKWDSAIQRAKGRSETARILNEDLDSQQNRIRKDYLSLVEKDEFISAEKLKDMLTGKYLKYSTWSIFSKRIINWWNWKLAQNIQRILLSGIR